MVPDLGSEQYFAVAAYQVDILDQEAPRKLAGAKSFCSRCRGGGRQGERGSTPPRAEMVISLILAALGGL